MARPLSVDTHRRLNGVCDLIRWSTNRWGAHHCGLLSPLDIAMEGTNHVIGHPRSPLPQSRSPMTPSPHCHSHTLLPHAAPLAPARPPDGAAMPRCRSCRRSERSSTASTPPIHRSVDIFSITAQATASAGAPTVVEGEELPGRNKQRAEAWCVSQRQKCQSPVPSHAHQRVLPCVSLAGGCFRKWMPEGTATVYSMSMSC